MNILEEARGLAFWLVDRLKGNKISRHIDDLKVCIGHDGITSLGKERVEEKIINLLKHAVSSVPYYNGYSNRSLVNFPVVDKAVIRASPELFLSSSFDDATRYPAVTSGSTGTPFRVYHNSDKKNRNSADTIFFASKAGFKVGQQLLYLKIWSGNNAKSTLKGWLQNVVPIDVIHFNENKIEQLIKHLEGTPSTFGFLGYSSALELIANYLIKTNRAKISAKISSVISMSESLDDFTRTTLSEIFNVQVVSRYSNIENGIIAQQETNGKLDYLINRASYHLEILELDSNNPVENGQLGRIVITDLYNYAMPMIRYDTGDVGAFVVGNQNYLSKIEGRVLDQIFGTDGNLVSSYIVYKNMWQYTEILQYQLVQFGEKDYNFKINCEGLFEREKQLISEFKEYLGEDANFKVEYVEEIPLLASGKRKKIMNIYHQNQKKE